MGLLTRDGKRNTSRYWTTWSVCQSATLYEPLPCVSRGLAPRTGTATEYLSLQGPKGRWLAPFRHPYLVSDILLSLIDPFSSYIITPYPLAGKITLLCSVLRTARLSSFNFRLLPGHLKPAIHSSTPDRTHSSHQYQHATQQPRLGGGLRALPQEEKVYLVDTTQEI
jgi:hypothetical protein